MWRHFLHHTHARCGEFHPRLLCGNIWNFSICGEILQIFKYIICRSRLKSLDISFNQLSSVDINLLACALQNIEEVSVKYFKTFKTNNLKYLKPSKTLKRFPFRSHHLFAWESFFLGIEQISFHLYLYSPEKFFFQVNLERTFLSGDQLEQLLQELSQIILLPVEGRLRLKKLNLSFNNMSTLPPLMLARFVSNLEQVIFKLMLPFSKIAFFFFRWSWTTAH